MSDRMVSASRGSAHPTRRAFALLTAVVLVLAWAGLVAAPAKADTAPINGLPATVSADALPTLQVNGIVWAQVTVGNTVYATGHFTEARPAGAAAGVSQTARGNLLAYDITTGKLITTFSHSLNAQGMVLSASPDGSTVYVGGDFTKVDGLTRGHIAAFSTATGALKPFAPALNARVHAIAASNSAVYVGGSFTTAAGVNRSRLAAFTTAGALTTWAPSADNEVDAMVLSPLGKVIVGGHFAKLNGIATLGLGAISPTGAALAWAANQKVKDSGVNSGITSLTSDGSQIYGTGYVFGPGGNLEGSFAADPETGAIHWIEDCHGDTYDSFPMGQTLYVVSHSHYCGNIGGFPQTNPWGFYRSTAFTTYPTGTIAHNSIVNYTDWYGNPSPTQLDWYPTLTTGPYSGQSQAAWSVTGNSQYVALGGEFPTVNGAAQQSLVRFAVRAIAPNLVAPRPLATLTPHVVSLSSGTLRVGWQATFDQDNQQLTYNVIRDGQPTPIYTATVNSTFWQRPAMGFTDTGLTPGSTHTYRVSVTDPLGNTSKGSTVTATVGSGTVSSYVNDVRSDGATDLWRLGEASGTVGYDWAGYNDLNEQSGVGHGVTGAINGDSNGASTFTGTSTGSAASTVSAPAPDTFTVEAWFKTTSTTGGKIIGYGDTATGPSINYDRLVYLDNAGHLHFGVYHNGVNSLVTTGTYRDGAYHYVVASLSSAGMALYVDGKQVATKATPTAGKVYSGYWRVGGDNVTGWPSAPSSAYLKGTIDDVAVYPTALNLTQVQKHYTDSGRTLGVTPPPPVTPGQTPIAAKYAAMGGASSVLGAVVGTEHAVTGGTAQNYAHGAIYYSAATGAHEVEGGINTEYLAVNGPTVLGLPTSDQLVAPDGAGRYNQFSKDGAIYWRPATGAHAVMGPILDSYVGLSATASWLGYPTKDQVAITGGTQQSFQSGTLTYNSTTHVVTAAH